MFSWLSLFTLRILPPMYGMMLPSPIQGVRLFIHLILSSQTCSEYTPPISQVILNPLNPAVKINHIVLWGQKTWPWRKQLGSVQGGSGR